MNDTTLEAPKGVQDPATEYLDSPIYWVFLFFIAINFSFQVHCAAVSARSERHANNTRTHNHTTVDHAGTETITSASSGPVNPNSSQKTETGCCESTTIFKWKPLSPVITSRNIQCLAVIFSSIILLVQLMEGYLIMETLARITLQGPVDNEASPIKPFVLLSLILQCLRFLFILFAWVFLIIFGILLVVNQYDFIKVILETSIEAHHAGCQYAAKTEERVREDNESDLERGTYTQLEVIWESPTE